MTIFIDWLKQFRCRFISRKCGEVMVGERYEKPNRKTFFRCGTCNRIVYAR